MRLLLTSGGLSTAPIRDALAELADKPLAEVSVGVINEAVAMSWQPGKAADHTWNLTDLANLRATIGGHLELVNLLAHDREVVFERFQHLDSIYVCGGDSDYLAKVFHRTGFADMLPPLLETKIYIGSSAGSMVLGRRQPTGTVELYGEVPRPAEYLNLVDVAVVPHAFSPQFPHVTQENLQSLAVDYAYPIYAISDAAALTSNGADITVVGSPSCVIRPAGPHAPA